ncbi:acyl carrier protein [Phaeovulum vinaykumarii]|uniref:Acyl carrier protein n=1 Tax=Phaeovulum vinaykumarii TaxID=407234 RepID=A0A1N7LVJ0_9RHOB|nr:acyl carrier protein [Phaeovulum vinaykumarii]SIS77799.1 acyl carrier protein [Phaeovulum vinaykumarii]SOC07297.1 acyl carrier protein [Phaeovulum vinaykumarii]
MGTNVQDRIIAIIAEQAVVERADVTPETTLESLGIDSLGLVETIFAIEEAFDISVPFNANEGERNDIDLTSVGAVVRAVEDLIAAKGGASAAFA